MSIFKIGSTIKRDGDVNEYMFVGSKQGMLCALPLWPDLQFGPTHFDDSHKYYVVSEEWPNNGIDFNRWWWHHLLFIKMMQSSDFNWVRCREFKYLGYQVDTRNNSFVVTDRDGNPADPITILNAGRDL